MDIKISKRAPDWDPHPEKSTTGNQDYRKVVIVEFPNQPFRWIPTYKQLEEIQQALAEIEQENRTALIEKIADQNPFA